MIEDRIWDCGILKCEILPLRFERFEQFYDLNDLNVLSLTANPYEV